MMKKKDIILFVVIFSVLLMMVGGTYAYWSWTSNSSKSVVFNTADLQQYVKYDEGYSYFVGDYQPAVNYCEGVRNSFSFYKTTGDAEDVYLMATINMDVNSIEANTAASDDVYWVITSGDTSSCTGLLSDALNYGTFQGKTDGEVITLLDNIEVTTTKQEFTVWLWIDSNGNDLSLLSGETLDTNVWTSIDMLNAVETGKLNGGSVTISGDNIIGNTLTANLVDTEPVADSYTYQWYYSSTNSTNGGTEISGATTNTLVLDAAYRNKYIYVVVTADKADYISKKVSDITDTTNNASATVSKMIPTLTLSTSSISVIYPSTGSFTYTYAGDGSLSCNSSDTDIATCSVDTANNTVVVTPVGDGEVTVTLLAEEGENYNSISRDVSVVVDAASMSGGSVTISGNNIVGNTLTATLVNTDPVADSYTYQWYTNTSNSTSGGSPISGATTNTYLLDSSSIGKYVYVVVTANKTNYVSKKISDITDTVISKDNATLTVGNSTFSVVYPNSVNISYTYTGDGTLSCNSSDTNVATCSVDTTNKVVKIEAVNVGNANITLSASEGTNYKATSQIISGTVTPATLAEGSVTISGTNIIGNTLTATLVNTSPTADNYTYQWYTSTSNSASDGTPISGATSNTLSLTSDYADKYVYVVVTASKANYTTKTISDITDATISRIDATMTVSSTSLDVIYPNSSSFTYTYTGDGTLSCSSSDTSISECSVNTSTNTVTITAKSVGVVDITLSASQGTNYKAISKVVSADIHYDTYTVDYYMNIEANEEPWLSETKSYSNTSFSITSSEPTRDGYQFLGWSLIQGDSTVIYLPGDTYSTNEDVKFYAVWELVPFVIEEDFADTDYDSEITSVNTPTTSATSTGNSTTEYSLLWSVTDGQFRTNSASITASGWSATTSLTSGDITSTIVFTPTMDVTMTFDYGLVMNDSSSATYTIKLNDSEVVNVTSATTSSYTAELTANTTYTLTLTVSHTTSVTSSFMSTSKTTAYAYIDNLNVADFSNLEYTVTYNANGGTDAPYLQTKGYNENLTLTTDTPTYEGYTFVEWNTSSDGSGDSYAPGATYSENSSVTLYAIWEVIVTFEINEDFADTDYDIITVNTPTTSASTTGGYGTQTSYDLLWSVTDGQLQTNVASVSSTTMMTTKTLTSGDITSTIVFTPTTNVTMTFDYGLVMNDSSSATYTIKLNDSEVVNVTSATASSYTAELTADTEYTLTLTVSHTTAATYSFGSTSSAKSSAYAYIDNLIVN